MTKAGIKVLLTGGAGFIGSHILEKLLQNHQIIEIRVLDNLETGTIDNISTLITNPIVQFIEGDIRNYDLCLDICSGIDVVCHQAALGSVPRSIKDPLSTFNTNVSGFSNMLTAAVESGVPRFVYASSSSVYGDLVESPKKEHKTGSVLSPYASSKRMNEIMAEGFSAAYGVETIGFRYFNVFGSRQNPTGPYAAVIPLFINAALGNTSPVINGDGSISRDFTPVESVVFMNEMAIMGNNNSQKLSSVYNVACGKTTSLNELWQLIREVTKCTQPPIYGPNRKGDILFSLADITNSVADFKFVPPNNLLPFLAKTIEYYQSNLSRVS